MKLKIIDASFHRNGICGAGFTAILFKDLDENPKELMVASLFDEQGCCAVYKVSELVKENIAFAQGNSWRGDNYEEKLRPLLEKFEKKGSNRLGCFSMPQKPKGVKK